MGVGIPQVAAKEHHRPVEQPLVPLAAFSQHGKQVGQQVELVVVGLLELLKLLCRLTVVAEVVIAVGGCPVIGQPEGGRRKGIDHQRHQPGRVSLDGQPGHLQHRLVAGKEIGPVGDIPRLLNRRCRLGPSLPAAGHLQPLLQLPDGGEVLIEPPPVGRRHPRLQPPGIVAETIENAFPLGQLPPAGGHLSRAAGDKQLFKQPAGPVLWWNQAAVAGPGEAAIGLVDVHAQVERREPGQMADLLGGKLVEGDRVAKAAGRRVAGGGEKAVLSRVPPADIGMGQPADHGEVVSAVSQPLQIRRQRVVPASCLRKERLRQDAEIVGNKDRPHRRPGCRVARAGQTLEPRQRQGNARPPQQPPTTEPVIDSCLPHDGVSSSSCVAAAGGRPRKSRLVMNCRSRSPTR